jgi:phage tail-like protein
VNDTTATINAAFEASLALTVVPDDIIVALEAEDRDAGIRKTTAEIWRNITSAHVSRVVLRSSGSEVRLVRLTIQSEHPSWNQRWLRWSYASRRVPESAGGTAVTAQDLLSADGRTLVLLVLAGETRSVSLESCVELDGETSPDAYPFDVVATDVDSGGESRFMCLLRLQHPPSQLLKRLPSIYTTALELQEETGQGFKDTPFFARFLLGFEDASTSIRDILNTTDRLVDADLAPAETLTWLATWVSLVLDENWPELKRRRLIKEAVDLYRWRGTKKGLTRYLEIYTGITPHIDDRPLAGIRLGPNSKMGKDARLGDVPPHTFVVTVASENPETINEQTVRSIIESEKPAHTAYDMRIVRSTNDL